MLSCPDFDGAGFDQLVDQDRRAFAGDGRRDFGSQVAGGALDVFQDRPGLDHAVPIIPQWRLSALPRYLPADAVERVIASCDLTKSHGIRDRAILLLLARLGLRAGDVLTMRLGDISWDEGSIRVRGKGRREIRLPLPQDAGDALIAYLSRARPRVDEDRVFLRS